MKYIKEDYAKFYNANPDKSFYGNPSGLAIKIASLLAKGQILDLGAGDGRQALYLASLGFEVTAVDLSEAGLEKLQRLATQQNLSVTTEFADLNSWSIRDEYDAIIAMAVLQHLTQTSALRILKEMKDRTLPNGINAITAFTKTGDRYIIDREEDPESFYPDDNWLKEFYSDWDIIDHSFLNNTEKRKLESTGMPMQNIIEVILAQKPGQ